MTVKELKKLIKKLPDDMDVFIDMPDDILITACFVKSEVEEVMIPKEGFEEVEEDDLDENDMEKKTVFILRPCGCNEEMPEGSINSQPELN